MITLYDVDALKALARNTNRQVAFLVGAPLSFHDGRGVPGVDGVLAIIRAFIAQRAPQDLPAFESVLQGAPNAYQRAFEWLAGRFDRSDLDGIVRSAVLEARQPNAPPFDDPTIGEGDPADWIISPGLSALAALIKSDPLKFSGPVLTTNFDPLMFLALRQAGGLSPRWVVLNKDGDYAGPKGDAADVDVVHLHGYWRNAGTMHTPDQLTNDRPKLLSSLRRLLNDRLLLVIGFGGWDDVITKAIAGCLADPQFTGEVRWCFRGNSPSETRERNADLLQRFEPGVTASSVKFHYGVDCHTIFQQFFSESGLESADRDARAVSPIPGWERIDVGFLQAQRPLDGGEAVKFFDGGAPTWRHAISAMVPRLGHSLSLVEALSPFAQQMAGGVSFQLIRSAGGEGKSTVLLQTAAALAMLPGVCVLWRPERELRLTLEAVALLPVDQHVVLVADQAENLVDDLWKMAQRLHAEARGGITILLAARDTDWRSAKGDTPSWSSYLARRPDVSLSGLAAADAEAICDAWGAQGAAGLRGLAAVAAADRADHLLKAASQSSTRSSSGSLLGALLDVRFDEQGLRAHVRDVMIRLKSEPLKGGRGTLLQALLPIAAAHSAGLGGLHLQVVRSLTDTPESWVTTTVVKPLGAELGVGWGGELVETRHKRVADAIIVECETLGIAIEDIWRQIIRVAAELGRSQTVFSQHGQLLFVSRRLLKGLPSILTTERQNAIALSAAKAAVELQPQWLGCIVNLGATLQEIDDPQASASVFIEYFPSAGSRIDYSMAIRGFLSEWGVSENLIKRDDSAARSTWLVCASLSDQYDGNLDRQRIIISTSSVCVPLGVLANSEDNVFSRARRAAERLCRRTLPPARTTGFLDGHKAELDVIGARTPTSLAQTLNWLAAGATAAAATLDGDRLPPLQQTPVLTFKKLRTKLSRGWLSA